jgi:hypothetical protein
MSKELVNLHYERKYWNWSKYIFKIGKWVKKMGCLARLLSKLSCKTCKN